MFARSKYSNNLGPSAKLGHVRAGGSPDARRADSITGQAEVFPQKDRRVNPQTGEQSRCQADESILQGLARAPVRKARIPEDSTCHTFRHSFATQVLHHGYDIRSVQELLGHKDVKTMMACTHVLNRVGKGVRRPVDAL